MFDPRWDKLTDAEWHAFAQAWNSELKGIAYDTPLPSLPWLLGEPPDDAMDYVVPMNFSASPSAQWKFILAAYWSGDKDTFGHLAAGPIEHILGTCGDSSIEAIEQLAEDDPLFANLLKECNQYRMTDAIWDRVCKARGDVG